MVCKTNTVKKINGGHEAVKARGIAAFFALTPGFRAFNRHMTNNAQE